MKYQSKASRNAQINGVIRLENEDGRKQWTFEQQLAWSLSSIYWSGKKVTDEYGNVYDLTCEYQGNRTVNDFIVKAGIVENVDVRYPKTLDPFAKPVVRVINPNLELIENFLMEEQNRGLCLAFAKKLINSIKKERNLGLTYASNYNEVAELLKKFKGEEAKEYEY